MTPHEFVARLYSMIVEDETVAIAKLFRTTQASYATDQYWKRALTLFHKLDDHDQEVLLAIVRQVTVDTLSSVLGVVDGVNRVQGQVGELQLLDETSTNLSGDLQDLFLELDERRRK